MQDDTDPNDPLDLPGNDTPPTYHSYPMLTRSKGGGKKLVIIVLLVMVVLGGLGFGASQLLGKKKAAPVIKAAAPVEAPKDLPDAGSTKKFENGQMGLLFTYPSTWTASETSDGGVRVESPTFDYPGLTKSKVNGIFRIYIRKGARAIDDKYIGRGVAIAPSEKLVYGQPALGQRSDTLISNFGLDTTDNFAFFLLAGNFQLAKGDTLGPAYGKEPETFIIGGGYTSKDNKDDLGTTPVPIDTIKTSNAYQQAVTTVKSLQLE
jgi:hypothetical protein